MTINDLLTALRTANTAVNPNGYFSHGRIEDVSLDFDKVNRDIADAYLIYLLPPRGRDDTEAGSTTYTCTVGFFKQDSQDSVPDDDHVPTEDPGALNRETIIEETESLMRSFMLNLSNQSNSFAVRSWDYSPKYRDLQGTYTGHAVVFVIESKLDEC